MGGEKQMKIVTIKGEWTVFDGERVIEFENGEVAFAYAMVMARIRAHKCITPSVYPVRSLVPHPKKKKLTKEQRERFMQIKRRLTAQNI